MLQKGQKKQVLRAEVAARRRRTKRLTMATSRSACSVEGLCVLLNVRPPSFATGAFDRRAATESREGDGGGAGQAGRNGVCEDQHEEAVQAGSVLS